MTAGLSDDVAVLRSCIATLPLSSFADLVSTIWVKKLLLRFLAVGTLRSAAWTLIAVRSGLGSLVERRERTAVSDCNADAQVVLG